MANTKGISRRIKSISSTKKITKAMEMVAAAKMRKAVDSVLKTRTYSNLSWEIVLHLAQLSASKQEPLHRLLSERREIKKVAVILIASNRGLCGGFNSAILNKVKESVHKHQLPTDFIVFGKRGQVIRNWHEVVAEFDKPDLAMSAKEIMPLAKMVTSDFLNHKYDKIFLAYTDFVSPLKQIPRVKQLLPIDIDNEDKYLGVVGKDESVGVSQEFIAAKKKKHLERDNFVYEYVFEPSPHEVLNRIIPRLIEVQLYQALLESNASEHSARMAAMRQATDAASDMVSELTLFFNKARQSSITSEIAEISAGANALAE